MSGTTYRRRTGRGAMSALRSLPLFASSLLAAVCSVSQAVAQVSLPPVNFGETNFLDGVAGPGWLFEETGSYFAATRFRDGNGDSLSEPNEVESAAAITHGAYLSDSTLFSGYWGAEVLLPVARVDLDVTSTVGAAETGVGDLTVSPFILQWSNHTFFGRPFHHRLNFDVTLPTGEYDSSNLVNPGDNTFRFNPYYAFTWEISPKWEVSGRLHYLWVSENDDPFTGLAAESTQAGQAFHVNFSVSREVAEGLRLGASSYFLRQITDDEIDGDDIDDSREQVLGLGPGVRWQIGKSALFANAYVETAAKDRPEGARFVLRWATPF